ncbi:hypothetical protein GCM10022294_27220 [Dietzia aurantiaca]
MASDIVRSSRLGLIGWSAEWRYSNSDGLHTTPAATPSRMPVMVTVLPFPPGGSRPRLPGGNRGLRHPRIYATCCGAARV